MRGWWWAPLQSWEQRYKALLIIVWLHLPIMAIIKGLSGEYLGWFTLVFIGFALAASIFTKANQELRASLCVSAVLTSSFGMLYASHGALEVHLHVIFVVVLAGMYQLRAPLMLAVTGIFLHHGTVTLLGNADRLFDDTYGLDPLWLVLFHAGFAFVVALVSRTRLSIARELQDQLDEVTEAFSKTARLANEEYSRAESAEQARDEFFSAIVHQLKTPLTVIQGYAEILIKNWGKDSAETQQTYLQYIVSGVIGMSEVIDTGLDVMKKELDGWKAEAHSIDDVGQCVAEILDGMAISYPVELLVGDISSPVRADKKVLETILQHLVDNACSHGLEEKPVVVEVLENRRNVDISVSNWNSIQEPPLDQKICFKRGHGKGTGFGLWIVKNYAQSMSSDINVYQMSNGAYRKTTFLLCIPKDAKTTRKELADA